MVQNAMKILRASEDYLEAMLMMKEKHGYIRSIDVAEQLGVSYRHLLRRLKALCEEGLLQKGTSGYRLLNETELKKRAAG